MALHGWAYIVHAYGGRRPLRPDVPASLHGNASKSLELAPHDSLPSWIASNACFRTIHPRLGLSLHMAAGAKSTLLVLTVTLSLDFL